MRTFLVGLVLACLLPGLIGATVSFLHHYRDARVQLEKNTLQTARALAQTVDSHLVRAQAVAQSLAASPSLAEKDFARFHRQAREVMATVSAGATIVLSDANGQQYVNTLRPFGQPLPRHSNPIQVQRVFETGKPQISDLFWGEVVSRHIMSVDVPVLLDGKVQYALSVGILPEQFTPIMQKPGLPPEWIMTFLDASGTIAARSQAAERLVGQKGSDAYVSQVFSQLEGAIEATTRDGIPVHSVFTRAPVSNWVISIGIPRATLENELLRNLTVLALGMAGLFVLGLVCAGFISDRIARSVRALTAPALALGRGDDVVAPKVDLKEAAEVANALMTTSSLLTRRTDERDSAREELERHREQLEVMVSERTRELEKALATIGEGERFIRAVTNNLPGLVSYWDADLRCRFANKPYADWYRRKQDDILGMHLPELVGEEVFAILRPHVAGVLRGARQFFERTMTRPSGEPGFTWCSYIPDIDSEGKCLGFYVLISDVTELKQTQVRLLELNEQMAGARDRAEAASRMKSEFVANMSHEIRTPMNAILGLSSLLEDSALGETERSYVADIKVSAKSLLGILNDILDFSKIEAGRLELENTQFSIEEVLRNTSVIVSANARDKGITTTFSTAPDVPHAMLGDPLRLQQVLLNLTGNAVKFTERGSVDVQVRKLAESDTEVTLEFSVRDTGVGIAPEHYTHIFDAFSQGDNSTSRRYGGTGLGLAISNRLVVLMGGALDFSSQLGKGSNFFFTARFGKVKAAVQPACPSPTAGATGVAAHAGRLAGLRVLLVEDNVINQKVAGQILRKAGATVKVVGDGRAAVDMLEESADSFDAVLMDIQTPVMDGYEATRIIRQQLKLHDLPIIAMTANAMATDRRRATEAGMDAYVAKPIDINELIGTLQSLVPRGGQQPATCEASRPAMGEFPGE
ncbi:hypothetical protein GCM10027343_41600 [Noviherbaspirillum agri]